MDPEIGWKCTPELSDSAIDQATEDAVQGVGEDDEDDDEEEDQGLRSLVDQVESEEDFEDYTNDDERDEIELAKRR